MEKRTILLVDSPLNEYYYHLCANVTDKLVSELIAIDADDLVSFERFYFMHQDEFELQFLIIDMMYVGFVTFFNSILQPKNASESAHLNNVLDKVYITRQENKQKTFNKLSDDDLLACLDQIQRAISVNEDMSELGLVSKCADLKNAVLQGEDLLSKALIRDDESVLSFGEKMVKDLVKSWIEKHEEVQVFGNMHYRLEAGSAFAMQTVSDESMQAVALKLLLSMGASIENQMDQVIYRGAEMSKEDTQKFLDLWLLLVSIDFKTVVPSSFFDVVKKKLA